MIITLWDMVWLLYNFSKYLVWIERKRTQALKAVKEAGRNCQVNGVENGAIEGERHSIYNSLEGLEKECTQLNLNGTYRQVFTLRVNVGNPHKACYWSEIESHLQGIQWSLDKELLPLNFVHIPVGKWKLFEKDGDDSLFGKKVYKKFKPARTDIKSAGTCVALDLHTAAVFHLMRATEIGLIALARHLKVHTVHKNKPIEYATWGEILNGLQQAIASRPKTEMEHYQSLIIECNAIKDLWRNPVSHSAKFYNKDEAMSVLTHVKEFMTRLAS